MELIEMKASPFSETTPTTICSETLNDETKDENFDGSESEDTSSLLDRQQDELQLSSNVNSLNASNELALKTQLRNEYSF